MHSAKLITLNSQGLGTTKYILTRHGELRTELATHSAKWQVDTGPESKNINLKLTSQMIKTSYKPVNWNYLLKQIEKQVGLIRCIDLDR